MSQWQEINIVTFIKYKFNKSIQVRETGSVIKPSLSWLGSSPDGLASYNNTGMKIGSLEIKCPEGKKNSTPSEAMQDPDF